MTSFLAYFIDMSIEGQFMIYFILSHLPRLLFVIWLIISPYFHLLWNVVCRDWPSFYYQNHSNNSTLIFQDFFQWLNKVPYITFKNTRCVIICVNYKLYINEYRKKSQTKILNKSGPRIERCGTPNNISSQGLFDEYILVLCFLWEIVRC